jgi:hypothetical protein
MGGVGRRVKSSRVGFLGDKLVASLAQMLGFVGVKTIRLEDYGFTREALPLNSKDSKGVLYGLEVCVGVCLLFWLSFWFVRKLLSEEIPF